MSKYFFFFFFFLFNYILCLEYRHLTNGQTFDFFLEEEKPIIGLYLQYSDLFEKDDKVDGNDLYFLKISKALKVNCIIQKEDPDDNFFNKETSSEISEKCQSSIDLEGDYKLIPLTKKLAEEEKIYFIFYVESEKPETYLRSTGYTVKKISFPKSLKFKDEYSKIKKSIEGYAINKEYNMNNINDNSEMTYMKFSNETKFYRVGPNKVMANFVCDARIFFFTKRSSSFIMNCSTPNVNETFNDYYNYVLTNKNDCNATLDMDGYVYIQPMDNKNNNYYYDSNNTKNSSNIKVVFNKIRLTFDYNFTNISEFNYTFIITENNTNGNYLKNPVDILDYFYFKNKDYNKKEFEIFNFTLDNKAKENNNNIMTIELKMPKDSSLDLYDKKKSFIYTIIAEISPVKMFQIYDYKTYQWEDVDDGKSTTAIIIISIILGILFLFIIILLIRRYLNKNKINFEQEIRGKKELSIPLNN